MDSTPERGATAGGLGTGRAIAGASRYSVGSPSRADTSAKAPRTSRDALDAHDLAVCSGRAVHRIRCHDVLTTRERSDGTDAARFVHQEGARDTRARSRHARRRCRSPRRRSQRAVPLWRRCAPSCACRSRSGSSSSHRRIERSSAAVTGTAWRQQAPHPGPQEMSNEGFRSMPSASASTRMRAASSNWSAAVASTGAVTAVVMVRGAETSEPAPQPRCPTSCPCCRSRCTR